MEELNSGPPKTNPSSGREEDLNAGPPDCKSSTLTTKPCCLLIIIVQRLSQASVGHLELNAPSPLALNTACVGAAQFTCKILIISHVSAFFCPQLLMHDPSKRLPLNGVLAHPWIRNNANNLETLQLPTDSFAATKH